MLSTVTQKPIEKEIQYCPFSWTTHSNKLTVLEIKSRLRTDQRVLFSVNRRIQVR